jgi:hypothetical protein
MNAPPKKAWLPKYQNSILVKVPRELASPHIAIYRSLRDCVANFDTKYIKLICQIKNYS